MKTKYSILMSVFLLSMILVLNNINAEMYLWNDVIISQSSSTVNYHGFVWFDDTSTSNIGNNKPITFQVPYTIQQMPFNLTLGQVDYCNFTVSHFINDYGSGTGGALGFVTNTSIETTSYFFQNTGVSSGTLSFDMRSRDTLTLDMVCHYTDSSELYTGNILFGTYDYFMPSFECEGCQTYSLEQISNELDRGVNVTENEYSIYNNIQSFVEMNFKIWLYISYLIKIAFVLVCVGLIFFGVYWVYKYLQDIGRSIE